MTENELSALAVDICFTVHKTLGPGLLEKVYEAAFAYELDERGILYNRQQPIIVKYKTVILDVGFRSDFVLEDKFLVELKSVEALERVHHKITLNYMRLTNIKLGILVNFNVSLIKEGIHRKILGKLEGC